MNPRRLLVALLAALLLSGGVTYILTRRINRRPAAAQTTQKYVAASRPLQAGEVLKPENLTLVNAPSRGIFAGHSTNSRAEIDEELAKTILRSSGSKAIAQEIE